MMKNVSMKLVPTVKVPHKKQLYKYGGQSFPWDNFSKSVFRIILNCVIFSRATSIPNSLNNALVFLQIWVAVTEKSAFFLPFLLSPSNIGSCWKVDLSTESWDVTSFIVYEIVNMATGLFTNANFLLSKYCLCFH